MALERDPLLLDPAEFPERDHLEATRVRENGPVPIHELVQAAEPGDPLVTRTQVQVVCVRQDYRGANGTEILRVERLDRCVRADRHELWGLDHTVRQCQTPQAGTRGPVGRRWNEHFEPGG